LWGSTPIKTFIMPTRTSVFPLGLSAIDWRA
jgi:hypothetical protein